MLNIFIVPSCIKALVGAIDPEERYHQTLMTFDSIRKRTKDSIILFTDSSIGGLEDDKKKVIASKVDYFFDYSQDTIAQGFNQHRLKSMGETYLLIKTICEAKDKYNLNQEGRMFKLGGRYELLDTFTLDDYKKTGNNFVFKTRKPSWMDKNIQDRYGTTHILETRLYSWSLNMVDEYLNILEKNVKLLREGFDTEHAHFLNIPKDKLIEFEMLNIGGVIAGYENSWYITE